MHPKQVKVAAIAGDILETFHDDEVPRAMAQVFIRRKVEVPSKHWSWGNRLVGLLRGHVYAAGYRQWQMLGRRVKKGQQAFHILGPLRREVPVEAEEELDDDREPETKKVVVGFTALPVFGYLQTKGAPLPGLEEEPEFLESLPLAEVARDWGLSIETYSADDMPGVLGLHVRGKGIGLATRNLSTWAHELIHAADSRLGDDQGSVLEKEVVAELGGAILLEALGYRTESDRGGCYHYIRRHCQKHRRQLLPTALELLERTCRCVELLLEEAERPAEEAQEPEGER